MDVLILAGGKGTRLAELTHDTPKGLAPIGDRPILWHIMKIFADQGHRRFILCVGYQGHRIAEYFDGPGKTPGWEVHCSNAGLEASKSQRVAAGLKLVEGRRFFLSYGDDLADVDLAAVSELAETSESLVTLTAVQPQSPFGVLDLAADGQITGFREKCTMNEWINGGFMSVDASIERYLHLGELEDEVFAALVAEDRLNAYRHRGFWKAMNTHKQYLEFNDLAKTQANALPWQR